MYWQDITYIFMMQGIFSLGNFLGRDTSQQLKERRFTVAHS